MFKYLPVGIGFTIIAPNALLFTCLAHYVLAESALWIEGAALAVSMCGVMMIGATHGATEVHYKLDYKFGVSLACMVSLGFAITAILNTKLKSIDRSALLFLHMAVGTQMTATLLAMDKKDTPFFDYPETSTYWLILLGAVANLAAVHMWTYSVQVCSGTTVALFRNISIVFGFTADLLFFDQYFT